MKRRVAAILGAFMLSMTAAAESAEIRVLISGGFSAAFAELAPAFERASGHTIVTTRAGSMGNAPGSIPSRLARGEPVDVLIMVGDAMEDLAKEGRVAPGSRVDLARSRIGIAVRAGEPKPDISTVDAVIRTLLNARSVGYSTSASGAYLANELFPRLGIAEAMKGKSKVISGPVAAAVARGEVELGLQQVSEILPVQGIDFVGPLPAPIQKVTVFAGCVAAGAQAHAAAQALLTFLSSPAAAPAIVKSALEPVAPQGRRVTT